MHSNMAYGDIMRIDPDELGRAGHFSQAVRVDGPARILYLAGQVAGDDFAAAGSLDFERQLHAVLDRIERILREGGMTLKDLVKVSGYITERANVPVWRKVLLARLAHVRPVSTLVVVDLIDPRLLVEVDAIAATCSVRQGQAANE